MLAGVSITPFGSPVVPPVPTSIASSSPLPERGAGTGSGRTDASVGAGVAAMSPRARKSCHDSDPSSAASRQTHVWIAGSWSRIAATSGANADW